LDEIAGNSQLTDFRKIDSANIDLIILSVLDVHVMAERKSCELFDGRFERLFYTSYPTFIAERSDCGASHKTRHVV